MRTFRTFGEGTYLSDYSPRVIRGSGISYRTAPSNKTITVTVPVYACFDGTTAVTQDDWNNVIHTFTATKSDGKVVTYEVRHNQAIAKDSPYKIYPATGVTGSDGSTYFPMGQWGFAVSPRNTSPYNYVMETDQLYWNTYTVEGISVEWVSKMGKDQTGNVEVVFIPNAQNMPNTPYTNCGDNAASFSATEGGVKTFSLSGCGQPAKNMRSVQPEFDQITDYGILYIRTVGYTYTAGTAQSVGKVNEVGSMTIRISVTLQSFQPDAHAQLIGPWAAAGYPISSGGSPAVTSNVQVATSTCMLLVSPATEVSKDAIKRGRAKIPRWHLVGTEGEKTIKSLGGAAGVHRAKAVANAASNGTAYFPTFAQSTFDGAVVGKTVLDAAAEGALVTDAYTVANPRDGQDEFVSNAELSYVEGSPAVTPALGAGEDGTRVLLNYYANRATINGTALAQGNAELAYTADTSAGKKVGITLKTLTAFPVGAGPIAAGENPENQIVAGWEPGLGVTGDIEVPIETPTGDGIFSKFFGTVAGIAGTIAKMTSSEEGVGSFKSSAANTKMTGGAVAVHGALSGVSASGKDASVPVQSTQLEVPENATYRAKIGAVETSSADYNTLKAFFGALPAASKYCIQSFDPDKLDDTIARITVTGQCNTLYTAFVSIHGSPLPSTTSLQAEVTATELLCLVASRVDPGQDVSGFMNTAIPITLIQDGKHSTGGSEPMYIQRTESGSDFNGALNIDSITQNGPQLRVTNANLGAIASIQAVAESPCNFTIAWPDKLVDPESGELSALAAGEKIFIAVLKSSAVTYSHPISEGVGTYRFCVWPNICKGTDLVPAEDALHRYTMVTDDDNRTIYKSITQGDVFTESVHLQEEGERRFTVQSASPQDAAEKTYSHLRIVRM